MFKQLFDTELQTEMEDYYLNILAPLGIMRRYHTGALLDPMDANYVYVVVKGKVSQRVFCEDGQELTLWSLGPGTIFGEMDFFDGERTILSTLVTRDSTISVIPREALEKHLLYDPKLYRYFIHSITRKHRLVILNYTTVRFNDVRGRIAAKILRMAYLRNNCELYDGVKVTIRFTHASFAKSVGISRSTLTTILKEFENAGYFIKKRYDYTLLDVEGLESQVKRIW